MPETGFFAQNLDLWMSVILTLLVVLIVLSVYGLYCHKKLKARYERFMGINKKRKNDVNMEKLLIDCVAKAESIEGKYSKLLEIVEDMQKNMQKMTIAKTEVTDHDDPETRTETGTHLADHLDCIHRLSDGGMHLPFSGNERGDG